MPASSGSGTSRSDQLHPVVMIECPRLLFPFARQIVAEAVRNGGFPPLYIDPIDFVGAVPPAGRRAAVSRRADAEPSPKRIRRPDRLRGRPSALAEQ